MCSVSDLKWCRVHKCANRQSVKLWYLLVCFVGQVGGRLGVSFGVFPQILCCTTSVWACRPMGAPAGQHNHCLKQVKIKRLSLRLREMDIDLEPWLNGLNYRVVLGAGQQRDRGGGGDRTKMEVETKDRRKKGDWRSIEGVHQSLCVAGCFYSLASITHPESPYDTPKHRPGLCAVMSQLALEELAVGDYHFPFNQGCWVVIMPIAC